MPTVLLLFCPLTWGVDTGTVLHGTLACETCPRVELYMPVGWATIGAIVAGQMLSVVNGNGSIAVGRIVSTLTI